MAMNDADLLWLSDQNLTDFVRFQARSLPNYVLSERDGLLFAASGTRFPAGSFNSVFPLGQAAPDASSLVAEASRFFAALDRGYTIFAPAHLGPSLAQFCEAAQFMQFSDAPGMVLTERVMAPVASDRVALRFARDARGGADFSVVCSSSYETLQQPPNVTQKVFSMSERWLLPNYHTLVAYEDERPVSAATVLFSHGVAGVYWVGTIPDARGRGYAELVMRAISNHAFDCGARVVLLQATPFGEPIYRKLGYREFTRYRCYLVLKQST